MLVPGAIAATWPAAVMKVPADAACAPGGETYTTTGTGDAKMDVTIFRVDDSSPPGVSISTTTTAAPSRSAFSRLRSRNRWLMG